MYVYIHIYILCVCVYTPATQAHVHARTRQRTQARYTHAPVSPLISKIHNVCVCVYVCACVCVCVCSVCVCIMHTRGPPHLAVSTGTCGVSSAGARRVATAPTPSASCSPSVGIVGASPPTPAAATKACNTRQRPCQDEPTCTAWELQCELGRQGWGHTAQAQYTSTHTQQSSPWPRVRSETLGKFHLREVATREK